MRMWVLLYEQLVVYVKQRIVIAVDTVVVVGLTVVARL